MEQEKMHCTTGQASRPGACNGHGCLFNSAEIKDESRYSPLKMSPGRKVLNLVHGTVKHQLWCKLLALLHVLKCAPVLLQSHAREIAELLAALQLERCLMSIVIVWKQRMLVWVDGRIVHWEHTVDMESVLLHDVLVLFSLLVSLVLLSVRIVDIEGM
ncbi:predicted protein [Postia placenta Mad-698-R]|nr:predicted protein [Postia placenta Mad-698-R]